MVGNLGHNKMILKESFFDEKSPPLLHVLTVLRFQIFAGISPPCVDVKESAVRP